jgi:hypothetical protein
MSYTNPNGTSLVTSGLTPVDSLVSKGLTLFSAILICGTGRLRSRNKTRVYARVGRFATFPNHYHFLGLNRSQAIDSTRLENALRLVRRAEEKASPDASYKTISFPPGPRHPPCGQGGTDGPSDADLERGLALGIPADRRKSPLGG